MNYKSELLEIRTLVSQHLNHDALVHTIKVLDHIVKYDYDPAVVNYFAMILRAQTDLDFDNDQIIERLDEFLAGIA